MKRSLSVLLVWGYCCTAVISKGPIRRDTYLSAYMESHGPASLPPGEVYTAPSTSSAGYGPPTMATGSGYSYGPPMATESGYSYGPPPMAEPHAAPENPLDPLHTKIVLLFKILLKLLLFKLFVKFVAIICVLFFLPKLSGLGLAKEAVEDSMRSTKKGEEEASLQLTQFVLDAVSGAPIICREASPLCRLRRAIQDVDRRNSVFRLFDIYLKEEQEKSKHKSRRR